MPAFTVEKSIHIAAPCEQVFALVRDFRKWEKWSPWLIAEPEVKPIYTQNPDGYSWEGKITGAGEMLLEREVPGESMDCKLTFLKPWKSVCKTGFTFREKDGGTEVKWTMNSSLPFFLFFMKPMMTVMIGMDYERGLKMLKDLAETGSVPSVLEFRGEHGFPGCDYVGVGTECSVAEIGERMEADFKTMGKWLEESGTQPAGAPFAVYEKWELVKGQVGYVIGYPVVEIPANLPNGLIVGKLPGCPVYQVKHTGAHRHIGNAWAAGMMRGRAKVFAKSKRLPPFEIYETDPTSGVDEKEIVTMVCFPEKRG